MSDIPLDALRARLDAVEHEHRDDDDSWSALTAVQDRLEANRRRAEAAGWTSLALERDGARESLRLFGVPPGATLRAEVPDDTDPRGRA